MGRKSDLPFTLNCTVYTKGLLCGEGKEQTLITGLYRAENATGLLGVICHADFTKALGPHRTKMIRT